MHVIIFKKQTLGQWRRDDGEEAMFREIGKLVDDGWRVKLHGATHVREVEVYKS